MARKNNSICAALVSAVVIVAVLASERIPTASSAIIKPRFRRNVRDLYDMMTAARFKTINVAEVLGYGRFCGLGNEASQQGMEAVHALAPLDPIDGCCKVHDLCYDNLSEIGGKCRPPIGHQLSTMMRYLTPYYMEKVNVKHRGVKKNRSLGTATIEDGEFLRCKGYDWSFIDPKLPLGWIETCGVALCGCDYTLAKCIKQNEGSFNRSHLSARSLVDQASDQFGPAARHGLELVRTSTTIGRVHSNVMDIFNYFSSWAPKSTSEVGTQTDSGDTAATVHQAAQRALEIKEHHETVTSPWSLWG